MKMSNLVRRMPVLSLLALSAAILSGCEQIKSETPLSPSIAGPIAGVSITAPRPIEPQADRQIKDTEQPVKIVLENASSNGVRPFTMSLQIAADHDFNSIVFSQTGITPSGDGVTQMRLPDRLQSGRSYFWRTRADDGANSSGWSDPVRFEILRPIVIGTATPLSPIGNTLLTTATPQIRVRNGVSSGPHEALGYTFQFSQSQTFSGIVLDQVVSEGNGETSFVTPALPSNITVFWRVRISDGENIGAWSATESFRTAPPAAPVVPVTPTTPGKPGSCASSDGKFIVTCIAAKYPERLIAGVSESTRIANMEFLRNSVIEAGICGGLDLAWNRKRGTGPHSIDALAWRTGGRDEVVDIGQAYDDTSRPLRLQWGIVDGPSGYDPYSPRPNCN